MRDARLQGRQEDPKMRTQTRSGRWHALLLALATVTATSAAWADDDQPTPDQGKPQLSHEQAPGSKPEVGPTPSTSTQRRSYEPTIAKPPEPEVKAPPTKREITRQTMDKPLIDTYLRTWPEHAFKAAEATIATYGLPNEATPSMLIWKENGPWLRTIIYKDEIVHDFPRTHYDVIENVVQLKVPPNKVNDIVAFEGSVTVKRTEGVVSVRTNNEAMSFLAINLVNDIATGKKSAQQARKDYARGVVQLGQGEPPVAATKLQFTPADDRAQDPDKSLLKNDYVEPGEKEPAAPATRPAPPLPGPDDLRPGGKPNDLNQKPAPTSTPGGSTPVPKAIPGPKNGRGPTKH
jgi:hypothetical protein